MLERTVPAAEARAQLKCGACRFQFCAYLDGIEGDAVPPISCPRCGHACSTRAVQALLTIMRAAAERLASTTKKESK
jgi:hypothetical protein